MTCEAEYLNESLRRGLHFDSGGDDSESAKNRHGYRGSFLFTIIYDVVFSTWESRSSSVSIKQNQYIQYNEHTIWMSVTASVLASSSRCDEKGSSNGRMYVCTKTERESKWYVRVT